MQSTETTLSLRGPMPKLSGFSPVPIRGPRPIPLLGPLGRVLQFFGDPASRMLALHREFGDIAAVTDRSPALVCAFGAELNREVITNHAIFEHTSEVPLRAPPGSALSRFNTVLPFLNGDTHRRRRRLMMPAFQKAALDGYAGDIVAVTNATLTRWPTDRVVDVAALLRQLTVFVALRSLFGLDALDGKERLGELVSSLLDALASSLAIALPVMLPGTPFHTAVTKADHVENRLRDLIAEKRRNPGEGKDVLSILLRAHDEDGSTLSEAELLSESNGLFVAGYDTSAQTLSWTLFLLAQHPKVLADVRDELAAVLRGGEPTPENIGRLVLLDRLIKESMRLLPAAPMLFIRVAAREAPLGPYVLPAKANVVLSPLVTHRDPERFPEPARFRPERWERLEPTAYEYLPFGAGPRMCLGAAFAGLSLRLMLAQILQRFSPKVPDGARISHKVRGIALAPGHGLPMTLSPDKNKLADPARVRGNIGELVALS